MGTERHLVDATALGGARRKASIRDEAGVAATEQDKIAPAFRHIDDVSTAALRKPAFVRQGNWAVVASRMRKPAGRTAAGFGVSRGG